MTETLTWTAKEIEILEALALKVRVFSREQLAHAWFADDPEAAERGMLSLCEAGLVERLQVFAHPIIPVSPPAFSWTPGDPEPDAAKFVELSQRFQGRWGQAEERFTVYVTTAAGANAMGSYMTERPSDEQWTHDIHVGQVYVDMMDTNTPEQMQNVIGEGALPKLGLQIYRMKDPDLFVTDEHRQATVVVEFAGAYDEKHIEDLHTHCAGEAFRKLKERYPDRKHRLYADPKGTPYVLL